MKQILLPFDMNCELIPSSCIWEFIIAHKVIGEETQFNENEDYAKGVIDTINLLKEHLMENLIDAKDNR